MVDEFWALPEEFTYKEWLSGNSRIEDFRLEESNVGAA
jgi:hypothetical protein